MDVTVIIPLIFVILSLVIYLLSKISGKRRSTSLKPIAEKLGFSFAKEVNKIVLKRFKHFHLFWKGDSETEEVSNMMKRKMNDVEIRIFDYAYYIQSDQSYGRGTPYSQTVILFQSENLQLPDFLLRPERITDKIGTKFGIKDIDFDSHPKFSKRYMLQGNNEEKIRNLFKERVLLFFENHLEMQVEGLANQLIYYEPKVSIPPESLYQFIENGWKIFNLFTNFHLYYKMDELPLKIICPNCGMEPELEENERLQKEGICNLCKKQFAFNKEKAVGHN